MVLWDYIRRNWVKLQRDKTFENINAIISRAGNISRALSDKATTLSLFCNALQLSLFIVEIVTFCNGLCCERPVKRKKQCY
jgi:hypothetical protein